MPEQLTAIAQPEKRLFISLITRDISLADAILDLIDNSINSAIQRSGKTLARPSEYISLLSVKSQRAMPTVDITFTEDEFSIKDTCGGISLKLAQDHVFRFGRNDYDEGEGDERHDTLSVYGIGLKRAIFKIGEHIRIRSAHRDGGFKMDLHVKRWEKLVQKEWRIPIERYEETLSGDYGTQIEITNLFPDIRRRLNDGTFDKDLVGRISRTYGYFLDRVVHVSVNQKRVPPADIQMGRNLASKTFTLGKVACTVMAGISVTEGKFHRADVAGWYVFCNGRAIAFADKTVLTGWGVLLPTFQPKHRPFLGLVFFTSTEPEELPWNTTKSSINQESGVWQHALRIMGSVGKQITSYLDSRYSDEGTEISTDEVAAAAGAPTSALGAISASGRNFKVKKQKRDTTSIQFKVKIAEINEVKEYLGDSTKSNGEIGRHVFDHFLENVVR